MIDDMPIRSRVARDAAERALVHVVRHYGGRPEFVVLGGLVPELLCSGSEFQHAGTIDTDIQVDIEIACGAVNTARLEQALHEAGFAPENATIWRWVADGGVGAPVVKFELLADLQDRPAAATISFDACENLGAVNLRGTGFAARDTEVHELNVRDGDVTHTAEVNVSGVAGFLLAKTAALRTAFADLEANFENPATQGSRAYVTQMRIDHPDLDPQTLAADAIVAVGEYCRRLRVL